MITGLPPVLPDYYGGDFGLSLIMTTGVHGSLYPGVLEAVLVEAHNDDEVFLDELNGVWRGVSNLAVDGRGRLVGKQYKTDPTDYSAYWLLP